MYAYYKQKNSKNAEKMCCKQVNGSGMLQAEEIPIDDKQLNTIG